MPLKMKVRNVLGAAMICAQVVGATGQAQAADRFVSTAGSDTANDCLTGASPDRKSTRLNSSHTVISYAVFCLKKKTTAGSRLIHTATRLIWTEAPTTGNPPI